MNFFHNIFQKSNVSNFQNVTFMIIIQEQEIEVKLQLNKKEEEQISVVPFKMFYKPTISFDINEILVGTDNGFPLFGKIGHHMKHHLRFQNKLYGFTNYEIFALFIYMFKRKVDKKYNITKVTVDFVNNLTLQVSLENDFIVKSCNLIGLTNVRISGNKTKDFELDKEEYKTIDEIIQKYTKYLQFKQTIENIQKIMIDEYDDNHDDILNMNINEEYSETKMDEIKRLLSHEERIKYKLDKLGMNELFLVSKYFETIEDYLNLERCSKTYYGIMKLFKYNPISLTSSTRYLFPNIQQLVKYNRNDMLFEDDKMIVKRFDCVSIPYDLYFNESKQLEQWIGKKAHHILFDSQFQSIEKDKSSFDKYVNGTSHILVIITLSIDEKDIKFGCYIDSTIDKIDTPIADKHAFLFTLKDDILVKYDINPERHDKAFTLFGKEHRRLFNIGSDVYIRKPPYHSSVVQNEFVSYNYQHVSNALVGIPGHRMFIPKRIVVFQMI